MAKVFREWTVLPHGPVEKLESNLWTVSGSMPNGSTQRRMSVARLKNGELVIHNPIALDDAEMAELEQFGQPKWLPGAWNVGDLLRCGSQFAANWRTLRFLCQSHRDRSRAPSNALVFHAGRASLP